MEFRVWVRVGAGAGAGACVGGVKNLGWGTLLIGRPESELVFSTFRFLVLFLARHLVWYPLTQNT
jgi:hypothetical protein